MNAETVTVGGDVGDLCGVDEHLRRDAPDIEAGAAVDALLEDGNLLLGEAVVGNRVTASAPDDGEIDCLRG